MKAVHFVLIGGSLLAAASADAKFSSFDVQGATYIFPNAISDNGSVTGSWEGNTGSHGFVRAKDGTITIFELAQSNDKTYPADINKNGSVVGDYSLSAFLRTADGNITWLTIGDGSPEVRARGINNKGWIAGYYIDSAPHGFVRAPDGSVTGFDVPKAADTYGFAISETGDVTGEYYAAKDNSTHGFIRKADGSFIKFNVPAFEIYPTGINSSAAVVGWYYPDSFKSKKVGFVRNADGSLVKLDLSSNYTVCTGINDSGEVTGYFLGDSDDLGHGFLRSPDGQITSIDFPRSDYPGTEVDGINSRGEMTGFYHKNGAYHGFLFRP